MGNFMERSKLFNAFIVLVFFAHWIQLVWNQPLISRQSPVAPIPFNPELLEQNADLASPSVPQSPSSPASGPSAPPTMDHTASRHDTETENVHHPRPQTETSNSLCSIFRTFLDSRSVQCRVSRLNSGPEAVDSNALIQIRNPASNSLVNNHNPQSSAILETEADSRIDNFDHLLSAEDEDENDNKAAGDDTKVIQDKTTIIIPDRPCPQGQRRDPRGYCRTVLRIRTYNGQQITVRPVRFYYKRFVAIPALHFILP